MRKIHTMVLIVLVLSAFCLRPGQAAKPPAGKAAAASLASGNNAFALDLYAKLRTGEGNLFFSPYSISTALAMTYAGARGETERQMAGVLHFDLPQSELHPALGAMVNDLNARGKKGYQLVVANALWGQKGYRFLTEFLGLTRTHYGAGLNEVDFARAADAARKTINAWVEKQTRDKIRDLIKPGVLGSLTRLVLTNAIYFKGDWASQFKERSTRDEPFTMLDGKQVHVPIMNQTTEFRYMETDSFQALEMPYVGEELSIVVFLPRKTDGLPAFEQSLSADNLTTWLSRLRKRKVLVGFPRFKMTSSFELADVLKAMGMATAFTGAADFSGMTGGKDLHISNVIHKAFVEVNEEGTEAAAATAVVMRLTAALPEPTPSFRADHPFLFLIRDNKTHSILFLGRVLNPKG